MALGLSIKLRIKNGDEPSTWIQGVQIGFEHQQIGIGTRGWVEMNIREHKLFICELLSEREYFDPYPYPCDLVNQQ
jgi:hypothetical protein